MIPVSPEAPSAVKDPLISSMLFNVIVPLRGRDGQTATERVAVGQIVSITLTGDSDAI
jgi:hypothetical protein